MWISVVTIVYRIQEHLWVYVQESSSGGNGNGLGDKTFSVWLRFLPSRNENVQARLLKWVASSKPDERPFCSTLKEIVSIFTIRLRYVLWLFFVQYVAQQRNVVAPVAGLMMMRHRLAATINWTTKNEQSPVRALEGFAPDWRVIFVPIGTRLLLLLATSVGVDVWLDESVKSWVVWWNWTGKWRCCFFCCKAYGPEVIRTEDSEWRRLGDVPVRPLSLSLSLLYPSLHESITRFAVAITSWREPVLCCEGDGQSEIHRSSRVVACSIQS